MLYLTARVDGKLVGGASIYPKTDKHTHVASYGIFIGKNYRNLGLGTLLTKEFVEIAKKQELEILQLSVYASNERAFHVYKKCGSLSLPFLQSLVCLLCYCADLKFQFLGYS